MKEVKDLLGRIAFQATATLDGEGRIELDGNEFHPVLAFSKDEDFAELIAVDESSWMHEYALGWVDEIVDAEKVP